MGNRLALALDPVTDVFTGGRIRQESQRCRGHVQTEVETGWIGQEPGTAGAPGGRKRRAPQSFRRQATLLTPLNSQLL